MGQACIRCADAKIKEGLTEDIKRAFDAANIMTPYPHMRLLLPKESDYAIVTEHTPTHSPTDLMTDNTQEDNPIPIQK